jgi:hypothetical protein
MESRRTKGDLQGKITMITVLENNDFFEEIFNTCKEAEEYYSTHPEQESCRLIELPFEKFPLYVLEMGRGNFKYFENDKMLITFLKEFDLNSLPKSKTFVLYIFDDNNDNYNEGKDVPGLNIYYIQEPYRSYTINQDCIGGLDHYHFDFETLDEVIKTESLTSLCIE